MTKAEALHVFATAIMRELLREDGENVAYTAGAPPPPDEPPSGPQPRFDFDESNDVCEHGGIYFDRKLCPVHGDDAQAPVSDQELDDITSDEPPNAVLRAQRLAEQRAKRAAMQRLFPEDLPMSGMGPPEDLP